MPHLKEKKLLQLTQSSFARLLLMTCVALPIAACATGNGKPFEPQFQGVWSDAHTNSHWLEIDAGHFAAYGATPDGRCAVTRADSTGRDRVMLPVSPIGVGPMALSLEGATLTVAGKREPQRFGRSSRKAICLGSDGAYLPGAPYPKR